MLHCVFLAVEKLVDALRCYSSPVISAEVFLTFRVMLLQLSGTHLVSLWPALFSELVSKPNIVPWSCQHCWCVFVSSWMLPNGGHVDVYPVWSWGWPCPGIDREGFRLAQGEAALLLVSLQALGHGPCLTFWPATPSAVVSLLTSLSFSWLLSPSLLSVSSLGSPGNSVVAMVQASLGGY